MGDSGTTRTRHWKKLGYLITALKSFISVTLPKNLIKNIYSSPSVERGALISFTLSPVHLYYNVESSGYISNS